MISLYSSKVVRSTLLGLTLVGLAGSCVNTQAMSVESLTSSFANMQRMVPQSVKKAAVVAAFVIPAVSAYIALTQDEQPVLKNGTQFEKAVNWYRRVVCGKASKKTQVVQPNSEIKDVYSNASGMFGKSISWYDANEKDVKKAVGIGAIPLALAAGWMTLNTISEMAIQHALKAPYGEAVAKIAAK